MYAHEMERNEIGWDELRFSAGTHKYWLAFWIYYVSLDIRHMHVESWWQFGKPPPKKKRGGKPVISTLLFGKDDILSKRRKWDAAYLTNYIPVTMTLPLLSLATLLNGCQLRLFMVLL